MFFVGFFVSPAVIPNDSVPPSATVLALYMWKNRRELTSKTGSNENPAEAGPSVDKRPFSNPPVFESDGVMGTVNTRVDKRADDDEENDGKDFNAR